MPKLGQEKNETDNYYCNSQQIASCTFLYYWKIKKPTQRVMVTM